MLCYLRGHLSVIAPIWGHTCVRICDLYRNSGDACVTKEFHAVLHAVSVCRSSDIIHCYNWRWSNFCVTNKDTLKMRQGHRS